ncbi:MAG: four helix bundle protein [Proteobacteria bacterium]|nr:four helix bundle protein [Pseudomonadota bacterium]
MATVRRFEDLECWQEAREFVILIYEIVKNDRFKKDFELVSQIRRSAISSMANIAEGFHRNSTREFMKFLDYSRSSIAETVSHCYIAIDQKYMNEHEMEMVKKQADVVWKKVNNFISYLNKANRTRKIAKSKSD